MRAHDGAFIRPSDDPAEMKENDRLISLFLLVLVSTSRTESHVDLSRCYNLDTSCFGSLNKVKSVTQSYGCIKENNCNILLIAELKSVPNQHIEVTLISKWYQGGNSTFSRFSISKNPIAFNHNPGFIDARLDRRKQFDEWTSTISSDSPYIRLIIRDEKEIENNVHSAYYLIDKTLNEKESIIRFKTKSTILSYSSHEYLTIDLSKDKVYIHLQFVVDNRQIESASIDYPFKLFGIKDISNPPIKTPTVSVPTPTTALPSKPDTKRTTVPGTSLPPPTKNTSSVATSSTSKPDQSNLFIVIAVAIVVLGIIVITAAGVYCCLTRDAKCKIE